MTEKKHYSLFVYGPYMNPKYLDMHGIKYLRSQKAILLDYDICFSSKIDNWKFALIDIIEKIGHRVEGVVYEIDSNALQILDQLEEISEKRHDRIEVGIIAEGGQVSKAYTYVCPTKEGRFRPSKEYIDIIIEGANINNLS
jgi:gamma-glutamylcyclotransferase (GGCT)/AIG2-like uncharacterized protein YtfP